MSANLQMICKQQNISMLELTDKTGMDMTRVRAIFLDRWTPSPGERQKIAAALNLSTEDIAWGHQTPVQHIYGHGPS